VYKTIEFDTHIEMEKTIDFFSEKYNGDYQFKEYDFIADNNYGSDSVEALLLKEASKTDYMPFYNILKKTNAYLYSRMCHNFYNQLMHITNMDTPNGNFFIYNCGQSNICVVVAGCYSAVRVDNGKPFMSIIKTKNPDIYTNGFFGKTKKIKINDYYYVYSNWRRLTSSKITFMRDSFYSTLSSTMNSILSAPKPYDYYVNDKIQKIYSQRVIISYSTNQKIGELLMDTRYAYMSSLSLYTNINKLLTEKFGPPYNTIMETWIINRLLTRLPVIHSKALTTGITQSKIQMDENIRNIKTIGGIIDLPSLWFDYQMSDITELLDEAFIYVHTIKEPSNIFHENIKAMRTIVQYQSEFEKFENKHQKGLYSNKKDYIEFLEKDTKIGCVSPVIIHSVKLTLDKEKPFLKKNN